MPDLDQSELRRNWRLKEYGGTSFQDLTSSPDRSASRIDGCSTCASDVRYYFCLNIEEIQYHSKLTFSKTGVQSGCKV